MVNSLVLFRLLDNRAWPHYFIITSDIKNGKLQILLQTKSDSLAVQIVRAQ